MIGSAVLGSNAEFKRSCAVASVDNATGRPVPARFSGQYLFPRLSVMPAALIKLSSGQWEARHRRLDRDYGGMRAVNTTGATLEFLSNFNTHPVGETDSKLPRRASVRGSTSNYRGKGAPRN